MKNNNYYVHEHYYHKKRLFTHKLCKSNYQVFSMKKKSCLIADQILNSLS